MDDVKLNKAAIIEHCIKRVREEYAGMRKIFMKIIQSRTRSY